VGLKAVCEEGIAVAIADEQNAFILWGDEILRFERVKAPGLSSRKWVRIDQIRTHCGNSAAGAFTQLKTQNFIAPQYRRQRSLGLSDGLDLALTS